MAVDSSPVLRMCRSCGCTDDWACVVPPTYVPCHWVEEDLCSACADEMEGVG